MITLASIHGRFQPFHNGHLAYLRAALAEAEHVYIGLTRVLTEGGIGADVAPHRLELASNPLTYYQRSALISAVLDGSGIDLERCSIGPFPIEEPPRLHEFWPLDLPCFTTNKDDWNVRKIQVLEGLGYPVKVLTIDQSASIRSGTDIREAIRAGNPAWRDWVPAATWPMLGLWAKVW